MAEVKCYALKMNATESIARIDILSSLLNSMEGFEGINNNWCSTYLIFDNEKNALSALDKLKRMFGSVKKRGICYIDEKYLRSEYKYESDPVVEAIMEKIREEAKAEVLEKYKDIEKVMVESEKAISEAKKISDESAKEVMMAKSVEKAIKKKHEAEIAQKDKQIKELTKELVRLEHELARMEVALNGGNE